MFQHAKLTFELLTEELIILLYLPFVYTVNALCIKGRRSSEHTTIFQMWNVTCILKDEIWVMCHIILFYLIAFIRDRYMHLYIYFACAYVKELKFCFP